MIEYFGHKFVRILYSYKTLYAFECKTCGIECNQNYITGMFYIWVKDKLYVNKKEELQITCEEQRIKLLLE